MKSEPGPPATLGSTTAAKVRIIVWCRECRHQVEPDPGKLAERYGAEMPIPVWAAKLVCSKCGGREVDFVLSEARRRGVGVRQVSFTSNGSQ